MAMGGRGVGIRGRRYGDGFADPGRLLQARKSLRCLGAGSGGGASDGAADGRRRPMCDWRGGGGDSTAGQKRRVCGADIDIETAAVGCDTKGRGQGLRRQRGRKYVSKKTTQDGTVQLVGRTDQSSRNKKTGDREGTRGTKGKGNVLWRAGQGTVTCKATMVMNEPCPADWKCMLYVQVLSM